MRKLLPLLAISCLVLYIGCGGDDESTQPDPIKIYRVVAYQASASPQMTDANDPIWDKATATTLDMKRAGVLPQSIAGLGPKTSTMQAIVSGDRLYLRFVWGDNSNSIWYNGFVADTVSPLLQFFQRNELETGFGEDQLVVLFDGASEGLWDAWHWRAAAYDASGFCADMWYEWADSTLLVYDIDTVPATDNSGQVIPDSFVINVTVTDTSYIVAPHLLFDAQTSMVPDVSLPNEVIVNEPTYASKDTSQFSDSVLYVRDARHRANDPLYTDTFNIIDSVVEVDTFTHEEYDIVYWPETEGWKVGSRLPGFLIYDSLEVRPEADLGSKWEVRTVSKYAGEEHVLVMSRKLNTGHTDDLNLSLFDSVQTGVVIADDISSTFAGSTARSNISDVWLILK
ncbi:MAG: hypothetical protein P1R58_09645 [bacterium]|nr:hypothetical protein [bacterium]